MALVVVAVVAVVYFPTQSTSLRYRTSYDTRYRVVCKYQVTEKELQHPQLAELDRDRESKEDDKTKLLQGQRKKEKEPRTEGSSQEKPRNDERDLGQGSSVVGVGVRCR